MRKIVVISDYHEGSSAQSARPDRSAQLLKWSCCLNEEEKEGRPETSKLVVEGGYLERLPLACVASGLVDKAEIWTHWRSDQPPQQPHSSSFLKRRSFYQNGTDAPFSSDDMLAHLEVYGPPSVLCVWGLGVDESVLRACRGSFKIYNSIDAPALRIPFDVSRHFNLVLTASQGQSEAVKRRHPNMRTAVLPIGPEFASPSMFHPLEGPKDYDVIYVAAAQPYKRHDVLFQALNRLPRTVRALCVFGYGEDAERLRRQANELRLNIDFVGPPGVSFSDVNRLMNRARIGVVCGVDDGAPAILTEYMLAGLPVLANAELRCGLQYINPQTGGVAKAEEFHLGIADMLSRLSDFSPRAAVERQWTWEHSIEKLRQLIETSPLKHEEARRLRSV
ncbi:glycosyltransferase family 4 protein [Ensifer sp.]|uniref:glycosyltransferase family 4 protein n=1 Tax=Ensifer sp. TaxID=1872086 RepID=UPI0028966D6C|nr:glycosyltransferase family 4 protein [Ensifer sp.]